MKFGRNITAQEKLRITFLFISFLTYCACFKMIADLYIPNASGYNIRQQLFGDDFLNMWAGSKLLLQGDLLSIFNPELYNQQLKLLTHNADYPLHIFSYPPHLLLLISGLGLLSYFQALVVWSIAGIASIIFLMRYLKINKSWGLLLISSPTVIANLLMGQNGIFTGVLLLGGLSICQKRPILAGILFALLTIKPQLGILIPFVLILTRNWKCLVATSISTIFLIGLSITLFGWAAWQGYVFDTLAFQKRYLLEAMGVTTYYQFMMPGFYANSFLVAEPLKTFFVILHTVIAIPVLYKTFQIVLNDKDLNEKTILGICMSSALISPYFFNYDMTAIMFGLILYIIHLNKISSDEPDSLSWPFMLLLWTLPLTTLLMRGHFEHGVQVTISNFFLLPSFIMGASFYLLFFKNKRSLATNI